MTGAITFAIASVLCAMADTLSGLLTWRILRGISGAALTACASAYLAAAYTGPRCAWASGI
jgi:MFS family permease